VSVASDWSVLPAASVARTENVCEPTDSPVYVLGEVHASYEPVSSLHAKVEPDSVAVNANVAVVSVVVVGGSCVIEVSGAVVSAGASTVHVKLAADWSVWPAWSLARTEKVCDPSPRPLYVLGEVHASYEPVSSLHSKVRLAGIVPSSLPVKVNDAVVLVVVGCGWPVIEVSGAVMSATVKVWLAGWPMLFASSTARTWNVWLPGTIAFSWAVV
jgi:hypothetical protein